MTDNTHSTRIGASVPRIDGKLKVTGAAHYPSDEPLSNPAYAFLVASAIARGRIAAFHLDEAKSLDGVLDILTYQNVGSLSKPPPPPGGKGEATTSSMESDRIWHDGQIIGVVVANTYEVARDAARRIRVDYQEESPSASFGSPGAESIELKQAEPKHEDPQVGNAEQAYAAAAVKLDAKYATPTQHHNPIELFTTTCVWQNDELTIYEPTQFIQGLAIGVAKQIGVEPAKVRVVSRFVGGGFGSRGGLTHRTAWIAIAARRLGRPVKLVATRDQGFTIVTYRAETQHHVRLGASADGKLQAIIHEGWEATSRPSNYNVAGTETTARMYGAPNVSTRVNIVHLDRNTPGFMRAPPDTPYMFALESAMDELALQLNMDPVQLRLINDTAVEPIKQRPYTSRSLKQCFEQASRAFGWEQRKPQPRSMQDGEWLIGYGCATAAYPSNIGVATARVTLTSQGKARVEIGAHEIGTGTYTLLAIVAADRLGLNVDNVDVELGDTRLPAAGLSAGSMHAASISHAVAKACDMIGARIAEAAVSNTSSPLHGANPSSLALIDGNLRAPNGRVESLQAAVSRVGGVIEIYAENIPEGLPPDASTKLYQGQLVASRGTDRKQNVAYAFGAQFVEVRVHSRTAEVRVPRAVGAFACGTIVNQMAARSQLMGGMIWGISAALHEATEIDKRLARYYNDDLAEYLIPVNADIDKVEVIMLPEHDDQVNPLGIKGIGEVGIVGMNAAVANAVYHATGKRIRELPIRIEKLL